MFNFDEAVASYLSTSSGQDRPPYSRSVQASNKDDLPALDRVVLQNDFRRMSTCAIIGRQGSPPVEREITDACPDLTAAAAFHPPFRPPDGRPVALPQLRSRHPLGERRRPSFLPERPAAPLCRCPCPAPAAGRRPPTASSQKERRS